MLHRSKESFQSLSGQCTSTDIGYRHRQHNRDFYSCHLHSLSGCKDGSFRIQRIKYGFDKNGIHPTFQHGFHLLLVRGSQFVIRQGTKRRIVHIRAHRTGFIGRSYGAGHKTWFIWILGCILVSKVTSQFYGCKIHLTYVFFYVIISHRNCG